MEFIIAGAGASGLVSAAVLAEGGHRVHVLEAREYAGGRAHTVRNPIFDRPVETGAEFIHGDLPFTLDLVTQAGQKPIVIGGEMWRKTGGRLEQQEDFVEDDSAVLKKLKGLRHDISVQEFIDIHLSKPEDEEAAFSIKTYVQGYYAADPGKASAFALREELQKPEEDQYRIPEGYSSVIRLLYRRCMAAGVQFDFNTVVQEVQWTSGNVNVVTSNGLFKAHACVLTIPIGVLRSGAIRFEPAIDAQMQAAGILGFGGVIKTVLQFSTDFFGSVNPRLDETGFLFSDQPIPTWWTRYPEKTGMITGWQAGPPAEALGQRTNEEIINLAIESLAAILDLQAKEIRGRLKAAEVKNWVSDPYCLGGYSYEVIDGNKSREILKQGVERTLFFAGEGLHSGPEIGTVEAALLNGKETAESILQLKSESH